MVSLFFALVALAIASSAENLHSLTDAIIDQINSQQDSWTAGRNFPNDTTVHHVKLNGVIINNRIKLPSKHIKVPMRNIVLPENFDPRAKWPVCPTLNEIRDQGACGSCWAIAAVEVMTDRYCIRSNGHKHFHFSAEDVLACSREDGCLGGEPAEAWTYFVESGVVSGGNFHSYEGCRPYRLPPHCLEPGKPKYCTEEELEPTPACVKKCQEGYRVEYSKDRKFGENVYKLLKGELNMKMELFLNGPVEASYQVYEDFNYYKKGVYFHTWGNFTGHHAVKILGYGVENGVKYWLAANSWGADWGDKGFFKIRRGVNECGIEEHIITGQPIV